MRPIFAILALALSAITQAQGAPFPAAEQVAILKAAGAASLGNQWTLCREDSDPAPASIESVGDLNGDGRPEALINQDSTFCYGATGSGFQLMTKQASGQWSKVPGAGGQGIATFLKTKGTAGWPDLEIGGPGFCFPVWRFDGKAYALNRKEYEGKACQ